MPHKISTRFRAAAAAFRKPQLVFNLIDPTDFNAYENRLTRYDIYWAFYENTVYDSIHKWSTKYKVDYGLYVAIRNIFSPVSRIVDFHKSHTWGGPLDPLAGDGVLVPSALPIITENELLRPPIAQLWQDSNWQVRKNTTPLHGSSMGDYGLRIVDDALRQKVYIEIIHPTTIRDVEKDQFGNVKAYWLEEERDDPRDPDKRVIFTEIAFRDGDNVVFQTLLDGMLFNWSDNPDAPPEWVMPYGFVPFLHGLHIDIGNKWGWAEMHTGRSKFQEVDDKASIVDDQLRKMFNAPFLITGMKAAGTSQTITTTTASRDKPMPNREDMSFLYGPDNAGAVPLVLDVNIADATESIMANVQSLQSEYPELSEANFDLGRVESAIGLRVARQPAELKIIDSRAGYDNVMVRAQQMGIAIGGFQDYEGYAGFGLDSFGRGNLTHGIGPRPVFAKDVLDDIETGRARWEAVKLATEAGIPLQSAMELNGFEEGEIEKVTQRLQDAERRTARTNGRNEVRGIRRANRNANQARPANRLALTEEAQENAIAESEVV